MIRLQTLIFFLVYSCAACFAQKFSLKDAEGCAYEFRIISIADHEVVLVSAVNKKHARLEIPGTVTYKNEEYTVVRVLSEALKDCDTELRVLSFPNTVKEIEGYLFGSAMKLMGGFMGTLKGGKKEGALSAITLESLRIPESVKDLGSMAFATSLSTSGNKALRAHIDELPKSVVPYTAEGYGLQKSAVTEYWEKHNPEMLSFDVGRSASIEQAKNQINGMPATARAIMLNYIESNTTIGQRFLEGYTSLGLTRQDVIALLRGEDVTPNMTATTYVPGASGQQPAIVPVQTTPTTAPAIEQDLNSDVDKGLPQETDDNENTFAIIFANENYQEESKVEYALNDGTAFKMYCRQVLGMPEENIHFRKDATLNNMMAELDWISKVAERYKGQARFIVYYAGHGIPDEANGSAYLLPVDGMGYNLRTGYSLTEFYKQLGSLSAKNVTVFMDACFSGSKRGSGMLSSARGVAIKAKAEAPQGNMVVFSAAQGDETAYPFKEKGHGMFTYYLLKKLKETNGNVSLGELGEFITEHVSRKSIVTNSKSQTPSITASPALQDSWRNMRLK